MDQLTTCLWFDGRAEEAAEFYTALFPDSRITGVQHYSEAGPGEPGSAMTVEFELFGRPFVGLNGGPEFHFTEAISLQLDCESQEEVDRITERLLDGGGEQGPCGWVKDRFGLSWQVTPRELTEMIRADDPDRTARVMREMFTQHKLDIARLRAAYEGRAAPTG